MCTGTPPVAEFHRNNCAFILFPVQGADTTILTVFVTNDFIRSGLGIAFGDQIISARHTTDDASDVIAAAYHSPVEAVFDLGIFDHAGNAADIFLFGYYSTRITASLNLYAYSFAYDSACVISLGRRNSLFVFTARDIR